MTLACLALAVLLDMILGEPRHYHPLAGFGKVAQKLERILNGDAATARAQPPCLSKITTQQAHFLSILSGAIAWAIAVIPWLVLALLAYQQLPSFEWLFNTALLYWAIGYRSLKQHVTNIDVALQQPTLEPARKAVAAIVSRDTQQLKKPALVNASIESTLENGSDAIFAAIFWFIVAGGPGVLLYRLSNTLDAMWGYRTQRYERFGKFSARVDDALNWLPARLVALSYLALGNSAKAWHAWHTQAAKCASQNAGAVMASGAGSLGIVLGGTAYYGGQPVLKPPLGLGREPHQKDILRALTLIDKTLLLWLLGIAAMSAVI